MITSPPSRRILVRRTRAKAGVRFQRDYCHFEHLGFDERQRIQLLADLFLRIGFGEAIVEVEQERRLDSFLQSLSSIAWFANAGRPSTKYQVVADAVVAWDDWIRDMSWAAVEMTLGQPEFFVSPTQVYQEGRWPCSRARRYPQGRFVVL